MAANILDVPRNLVCDPTNAKSRSSLLTIAVPLHHPRGLDPLHRTALLRRLARQIRQQEPAHLHARHRGRPEHRQSDQGEDRPRRGRAAERL
jgi:hypothetical protein